MSLNVAPTPIDAYLERQASGWQLGDDDGRRLGVFFDDGGFAAFAGLGAAHVAQEQGWLQCMEVAGGRSAGEMHAIALMSGQVDGAAEVWTEILPENGFGDVRRAFRERRPIADPVILCEPIAERLDIDKVCTSPTLFAGARSRMNDMTPVGVTNRDISCSDFLDQAIDGMRLPEPLGRVRTDTKGNKWADGGFTWRSTSKVAREVGGCTDVICVAYGPYSDWRINWLQTVGVGAWGQWHGDRGVNNFAAVLRAAQDQKDHMNRLRATGLVPADPGDSLGSTETRVQVIRPNLPKAALPGLMDTDPALLWRAYHDMVETTAAAIKDPDSVPMIQQPAAGRERSPRQNTLAKVRTGVAIGGAIARETFSRQLRPL